MAMNSSPVEVHGLVDIVAPAAPPDYTLYWLVGGVLFLIIILFSYFIWRRYFSRRGRARRVLRSYQRRFVHGEIDMQAAAYGIAESLRWGLCLQDISVSMPIPDKILRKEVSLLFFLKQLTNLRYARETSNVDMSSLFRQAQRWLRIWP